MYIGGELMNKLEKLYNISQAALLLGVSRQTIYRWQKDGKLTFVEVNGSKKVPECDIRKMRGE